MIKKGKKGKDFEKIIKDSAALKNIFFLRLQDNLKFGGKVEGARFSQKSPYDSIIFMTKTLYCVELKSTGEVSLSIGKDKMIKTHQIEELTKANQYDNVVGGFLIQFKERITKTTYRDEDVFFIYIEDFNKFLANNTKKSISYSDCKEIGHKISKIDIGKRKHIYLYNLLDLKDCVKI